MAISRMNMERQLRAGGGIMTLEEPRQGYFLGKIVKKAKRAVKKITKSPLGKAAILGAIGFGIRGGFGIFLTPISTEFGFGREVISLSIALQNLIWGISQPFMGAFADRFGAFKAILVGSLFYCLGMIC